MRLREHRSVAESLCNAKFGETAFECCGSQHSRGARVKGKLSARLTENTGGTAEKLYFVLFLQGGVFLMLNQNDIGI